MAGPFVFDVVAITRVVAKNVLDSHPEIKLDSTTLTTCLEEFMKELMERPEDLIIEKATEKAIAFLKEVRIM